MPVDDQATAMLIGGIPKPPDPPHCRRTPDNEEEQESDHAHGGFIIMFLFSLSYTYIRIELGF